MKNTFLFVLCAVIALNVSNVSAAQADRARTVVAKEYQSLKAKAGKGDHLRVIVKVKGAESPSGVSDTVVARQNAVRNNKQKFAKLKSHLSRSKIKNQKELAHLGYMVMDVDATQLDELIDSGLAESVVEDIAVPPALGTSIPHIGADITHIAGYTGKGQAVAIFDTGVESAHEVFGGRVVEEACFSSTTTSTTSLCPNGEDEQFGSGAAANCDSSVSSCYHGTHVAGIAAGKDGVAPEAKIVAVQIFSLFDAESCDSSSPCVRSYTSDQLAALEWVLNEATTENIAAINMSIGGGLNTESCDTDTRADAIRDLRDAGIATVIAAGNDYSDEAVSYPGCISYAITVGSTEKDADTLSAFSNSSELVDVLAPGSSILSAYPGGLYKYASGTSMATPHVAGAVAVLRSANSSASVDTIEAALEGTGVLVTDPANGVVKPRIEVNTAVASVLTASSEPQLVWPNGTDAVASSEQDANPAVNVGDGDLSTRWSAQYAGETITFDLGDTYSLSAINIAFLKGDSRTTYFDLAISTDGNSFTTVATGLQSSGSSNTLESFALAGSAQYVRIIGQGNSSNNWNSLTEVEVWGASTDGGTTDNLSANTLSTFGAGENSKTLTITANIDWTITSNDSWISVSPASGSNNGTSVVTVAENTSTGSRQGSIRLTGGLISQTITINQDGEQDALTVTPSSISMNYKAVPQRLDIASNVDWTISIDASWLTVSSSSGSNDGGVWLYPDENTSTVSRTATVTVIGGSITKTISFTQSGNPDVSVNLVAPEGLTASNTGAEEVTLNWTDASTGEDGYIVKVMPSNATTFTITFSISANSESYTLSDLPADTYVIRVAPTLANDSSVYTEITHVVPAVEGSIIETMYASSSSDDGNLADNAIDGDLSTRWSALGLGETLDVRLDGPYLVTDIEIAFYKGDQRYTYYQVEISNNSIDWTLVADGASSGDTLELEPIFSGAIDARYVRITGLGNSNSDWNSITEVQVKGVAY